MKSDNLYDEVCSLETLNQAWETIKAKNSSGGIDNVSVTDLSENIDDVLNKLSIELKTDNYIPEPFKQISIKKNETERRELNLLSVRDKIVQQAVKIVIEPILEQTFLNVSYAYRQNKNTLKAINRVKHIIGNEKKEWVIKCDIDDFFSTVDHATLLNRFSRKIGDEKITALVKLWIQIGSINNHLQWAENERGISQGSILSPLLANFYLHPFDAMLTKNKYGYVRYSDDFVIFCTTQKQAEAALQKTSGFLKTNLKLQLNPGYKIQHVDTGFAFLGISFKGQKTYITKEKEAHLVKAIHDELYFKNSSINPVFGSVFLNIKNYYGKVLPQPCLEKIDAAVVVSLKARLNEFYDCGEIKNKKAVKRFLASIRFFSVQYNTEHKRIKREILAAVSKKDNAPGQKEQTKTNRKILKKKKEYQKMESAGMELLINSRGVFIGLNNNRIVLKKFGKKIKDIQVQNLKNITIMSKGVSFSSNVIKFCSEKSININFLDFNGKPYAWLLAPNYQIGKTGMLQLEAATNGKAIKIIVALISGKIKNQLNLLKYYNKYRKNDDSEFTVFFKQNINKLKAYTAEINDCTKLGLDEAKGQIFSIEGRIASIYWDSIKALLNDHVVFEQRVQRGAVDQVNIMLNYGYGILYSRIWQALITVGLNPYISYLHSSERNKPALVYDFIEQFRQQAVDRVVFSMCTKNEKIHISEGVLLKESKILLAENIIKRLNTVERFRRKEKRLNDIILIQARALVKFLGGRKKIYKPYIAKW